MIFACTNCHCRHIQLIYDEHTHRTHIREFMVFIVLTGPSFIGNAMDFKAQLHWIGLVVDVCTNYYGIKSIRLSIRKWYLSIDESVLIIPAAHDRVERLNRFSFLYFCKWNFPSKSISSRRSIAFIGALKWHVNIRLFASMFSPHFFILFVHIKSTDLRRGCINETEEETKGNGAGRLSRKCVSVSDFNGNWLFLRNKLQTKNKWWLSPLCLSSSFTLFRTFWLKIAGF